MNVLAISGSLRAASINTALLKAASQLAPPGVKIELFAGLGELPIFNPDLESCPPLAARIFRAYVRRADALLIASPEYAHGVTGAMKNALDWLVGYEHFAGKAVAVLNASPRARHADSSLREILRTMAANILENAPIEISLSGIGPHQDEMVGTAAVAETIREVLGRLVVAADPAKT